MLRKVGAPGVEVGLDLREIAHIALAEKGIGVKLKGNAEVCHDLLSVADADVVKGRPCSAQTSLIRLNSSAGKVS